MKFELALKKLFVLLPLAYKDCFVHLHHGFAKSEVAPKGFASRPMLSIINLRPFASANEDSEIRRCGSMHGVGCLGFGVLVLVFAMQCMAR